VFSSPAVANGVVYFGSDDHHVYALNASTGSKLWRFTTSNKVGSSPAVANGVVYVGSFDNNVYALNANTGADALDPSRQEDRKIVQSFLSGDDWYKEVATFLVSMTTNPVGMRAWIVGLAKPFAKPHTLSDSEKRAGYLLAKLTETFSDCKIKVQA
jgi:hypothetical protein